MHLWSSATSLSLFLAIQALVNALPSTGASHVLHEKRDSVPLGWLHHGRAVKDARILLKIGIKQQNLHKLEGVIMKVSDPSLPTYGQHYSPAEVAAMFEPSSESIESVTSWLLQAGISKEKFSLSPSKGWVHADVSIAEAEELLKTQYQVYQHKNGRIVARSDSYHVASHVARHVDIITPTVDFDPALSRHAPDQATIKRSAERFLGSDASQHQARAIEHFKIHKISPKMKKYRPSTATDKYENRDDLNLTMANCPKAFTMDCARELYNIPKLSMDKTYANNSLAIFTQSPESFLQYDLDYANSLFSPEIPAGTSPVVSIIDGFGTQTIFQGSAYNLEANIDVQMALPMLYPANLTVFQVGDYENAATFNTFLDGIDETYCTTSGKDEEIDPHYPNPSYSGYHHRDCGTVKSTSVVSFSYGSYEDFTVSNRYAERQCAEWGKMGATGVSFLGASGDDGVSIRECWMYDAPVTEQQKQFVVTWPSGCPWYTSVGATEFLPGKTATDAYSEMVAINTTQSGGGFSNVFAMPEYQKKAVNDYFTYHTPTAAKGRYNTTGSRGYPDLSGIGTNFLISEQHELVLASGTSVSCPLVASMIAHLNLERVAKGKPVLGFVNPALYAHPEIFNDIVVGSNPGCHGVGFDAVPGWDPLSGMGTLDYEKFAAVLG